MRPEIRHLLVQSLQIIPGSLYLLSTSKVPSSILGSVKHLVGNSLSASPDQRRSRYPFRSHTDVLSFTGSLSSGSSGTEESPVALFNCEHGGLVYEPFFKDFGPLNIGHLYVYFKAIDSALSSKPPYTVIHYCGTDAHSRVLKGKTPEQAMEPIHPWRTSLPAFRDAGELECTFKLHLIDVLGAISKAMSQRILDFGKFDLKAYRKYERVENGDLNWIVPGKLIAFSGPVSSKRSVSTYCFTTEDYIPLFKQFGVTTIVRLNKKVYDRKNFTSAGFAHYDLFFADGTTPTMAVVKKFLEIVETSPGAVAIHCKAGLGRTGTLISCSLIKHYKFSAAEAIAWTRICRPGSVIGPQQHFVCSVEETLIQEPTSLVVTNKQEDSSKEIQKTEEITDCKDSHSLISTSCTIPQSQTTLESNTKLGNSLHTSGPYALRPRPTPKGSTLKQRKLANQTCPPDSAQSPDEKKLAPASSQPSRCAIVHRRSKSEDVSVIKAANDTKKPKPPLLTIRTNSPVSSCSTSLQSSSSITVTLTPNKNNFAPNGHSPTHRRSASSGTTTPTSPSLLLSKHTTAPAASPVPAVNSNITTRKPAISTKVKQPRKSVQPKFPPKPTPHASSSSDADDS